MFCSKCGNQVADGAAFCSKCGSPIAAPQQAAPQQAAPQQAAPQQAAPQQAAPQQAAPQQAAPQQVAPQQAAPQQAAPQGQPMYQQAPSQGMDTKTGIVLIQVFLGICAATSAILALIDLFEVFTSFGNFWLSGGLKLFSALISLLSAVAKALIPVAATIVAIKIKPYNAKSGFYFVALAAAGRIALGVLLCLLNIVFYAAAYSFSLSPLGWFIGTIFSMAVVVGGFFGLLMLIKINPFKLAPGVKFGVPFIKNEIKNFMSKKTA